MIKRITEITTGAPSPPFLIIAPSGEPIKKKMIQVNLIRKYLLCKVKRTELKKHI